MSTDPQVIRVLSTTHSALQQKKQNFEQKQRGGLVAYVLDFTLCGVNLFQLFIKGLKKCEEIMYLKRDNFVVSQRMYY